MYKSTREHQISFFDFNQSCGMQLDPSNPWILLADNLDWNRYEEIYASTFVPSDPTRFKTGRPAKSIRIALGARIIQMYTGMSDRKLVQSIRENPYYQYFLGMPAFSNQCPFTAPALVSFRKRIDAAMLVEINEIYLSKAVPTREHADDPKVTAEVAKNIGTQILDATCSPSDIKYPQDFELLNEAREKLEAMIDMLHETYHPWEKPRTYRKVARKDYLQLAKSRRRSPKRIRANIRRDLERIKRDLKYIDAYKAAGYSVAEKDERMLETIRELYKQQKEMFDNHTHRVDNRIVSLHQPYIRPIVRGKAKAPTEFGAKYDVSVDEKGHARLEKIQFDPYNEGSYLQESIERYKERTGHYPERVLVDQIYRTAANRQYCKERGIRISGPKLGRPAKDKDIQAENRKEEYRDNTDRIEVERFFSREKRSYGAGLIRTRLEETTLSTIAMAIFVANLFSVPMGDIFLLFLENCEKSTSFQLIARFEAEESL